jgi:hypothetical protein
MSDRPNATLIRIGHSDATQEKAMTRMTIGRRRLMAFTLLGLAAAPAIASTASEAHADQGNMEAALRSLNAALDALHRATPNKGGHKARAAQFVMQAMAEVQAGIDYADARSGE